MSIKTPVFKKTVTVGRMDEGKINLTLEIRNVRGPAESIGHRRLSWYHELSITGDIYYKNGRGVSECGQCSETIYRGLDELKPTKGVMMSRADLETILYVWDRWHLNSMHAGCKHQADHVPNGPDMMSFKEHAAIETAKCPNGYKYGSKWLVEPLPRAVFDRITSIFNKYVEV